MFVSVKLKRRTFHCAERTEHAAIAMFGSQHCTTIFTFVKPLAGIGRHGFFFLMPALWTGDGGMQNHFAHG
jgi:hypothetical protein